MKQNDFAYLHDTGQEYTFFCPNCKQPGTQQKNNVHQIFKCLCGWGFYLRQWTPGELPSFGEKEESDPVNKPTHYRQGKIEVIEFLEDQKLAPHEWNAVKYICRARHKGNELQDLKKARWYLDRKISHLEGESK